MRPMTCQEVAEAAPELALGVLPGAERGRALAHVESCGPCARTLARLADVGDGLLDLVPGVDPPLGFESRVVSRLEATAARPRRRWVPAVAAAIALAAGGGGWALSGATRSPAPSVAAALAGGTLRSGTQAVGQVFVYRGHPAWAYMAVDTGTTTGWVQCLLTRADGTSVPVGRFWIHDGYGYWGAPLRADPGAFTGARLVTAGGSVLATARLTR